MSRVSLNEIMPKKKKTEIKYIAGAVVFLALLAVVLIYAFTAKTPETEESVEAVKPSWDTTIRINEVMTDNTVFAQSANGRFYDWIELYNSGDTAFELSGHYLSDNGDKLDKYLIEELVINPGEYVLIYMSRLSGVDENGIIHTNFALSSLGETIYLSDSMGNVVSVLTVPEGGSNVSYGVLDDKLAWMSTPTPGGKNTGASSENLETLEYEIAGVRINEFMTGNKSIIYDCEGDYSDWVEIYNYSGATVDLSGYTMTDDVENTDKWDFPEGTLIAPEECLLIFCSGKDKTDSAGYIHTSFRLGKEESEVMLCTPQGRVCDRAELIFVPENSSYGYVGEGEEQAYFSLPTPGKANSTLPVQYTEAQLKKMQGIYE